MNEATIAFVDEEGRRENQSLLDALYASVEERALHRLVELGEIYGDRSGAIPLTQEVLAEMASTTRCRLHA